MPEENVPLLNRFWTDNKLTELNTSGGQENALLKQANFLFPLHLQNQTPYRRTGATLDFGHVRTPHLAIRGSCVPHIRRFEGMCTLTSQFYKGMASKVIQGNFYVEIFIVCLDAGILLHWSWTSAQKLQRTWKVMERVTNPLPGLLCRLNPDLSVFRHPYHQPDDQLLRRTYGSWHTVALLHVDRPHASPSGRKKETPPPHFWCSHYFRSPPWPQQNCPLWDN